MAFRTRCVARLALPIGIALFCWPGAAYAVIQSDADVVLVRQSCAAPGGGALDNCFTGMGPLQLWLHGTRMPTPADPVLVEIGPGSFGKLHCQDIGGVTLRGSGRTHTTLKHFHSPISALRCDALDVKDLRLESDQYGIVWYGGGNSTWTDVDIAVVAHNQPAGGWGWYEDPAICPLVAAPSVHYFYGSSIEVRLSGTTNHGAAYEARCDENWYFGGEIAIESDATSSGTITQTAVAVAGNASSNGSLRVFGAAIRSLGGGSANYNASPYQGLASVVLGLLPRDSQGLAGGIFHAHGTNILADASDTPGQDAIALDVRSADGFAHTPASSFMVMAQGSGVATRLRSVGMAQSPFLWPAGDAPPPVQSKTGHDLFVDTGAGPGGAEAHLMVYDQGCTGSGGPWRDMADGSCR